MQENRQLIKIDCDAIVIPMNVTRTTDSDGNTEHFNQEEPFFCVVCDAGPYLDDGEWVTHQYDYHQEVDNLERFKGYKTGWDDADPEAVFNLGVPYTDVVVNPQGFQVGQKIKVSTGKYIGPWWNLLARYRWNKSAKKRDGEFTITEVNPKSKTINYK